MASLVYTDGDATEHSFTVGVEPVVVGRAPECGIRSNHPLVSRQHARFYVDQIGTLYIEDLGSANGVFVGQHRVQHSAVPIGELVQVGGLTFKHISMGASPPPVMQPPPPMPPMMGQPPPMDMAPPYTAPPQMPPPLDPYTAPQMPPPLDPYMAPPYMAPPQMPPPVVDPGYGRAPPNGGIDPSIAHLLETERKTRLAAEEERDAYGERMAQLHSELRTARAELDEARAQAPRPEGRAPEMEHGKAMTELAAANDRLARFEAQAKASFTAGGPEARVAALEADVESYHLRVSDLEDRANGAEARLKSAEEELAVARSDLMAHEERMMSEMAASEQRAAVELAMRIDELNVARADLTAAGERIMDLTRKVSELEQQLAQARGAF